MPVSLSVSRLPFSHLSVSCRPPSPHISPLETPQANGGREYVRQPGRGLGLYDVYVRVGVETSFKSWIFITRLKKDYAWRETVMTREKRRKQHWGDASVNRHEAVTRDNNMTLAQHWRQVMLHRRRGKGDMRHETGDMRQEAWDRRRGKGDTKQEMWDRRRETGDVRHDTRDIIQKTCYKRHVDRRQEHLVKKLWAIIFFLNTVQFYVQFFMAPILRCRKKFRWENGAMVWWHKN